MRLFQLPNGATGLDGFPARCGRSKIHWQLGDPGHSKCLRSHLNSRFRSCHSKKKARTGHLSFHELTHALACLGATPPNAWKERQRNLPKVPCDGSSERLQLLEVMQHELLSMAKALVQAPRQKNYSLL